MMPFRSRRRKEADLICKRADDQERFRRRRLVDIDGHQVFLRQDKEDIRAILSVQRAQLDWEYINHWCEKHRTCGLLQQLHNTIPEV
jgi:hypothetical protein